MPKKNFQWEKAGKGGKKRESLGSGGMEYRSGGVMGSPPRPGRKMAPKRSSSMFMGVSCISKRSRSVAGRLGCYAWQSGAEGGGAVGHWRAG